MKSDAIHTNILNNKCQSVYKIKVLLLHTDGKLLCRKVSAAFQIHTFIHPFIQFQRLLLSA